MNSFPKFFNLPAELRIKIWQEAQSAGPSIYAFDVCIPSQTRDLLASEKPGIDMIVDEPSGVYLDQIAIDRDKHKVREGQSRSTGALTFDPSAHLATNSIRQSCSEAFSVLQPDRLSPSTFENENGNTNIIHLPARSLDSIKPRSLTYNNTTSLLHLRFRPVQPTPCDLCILDPNCSSEDSYISRVFKGSLSDILLYPWTSGISSTLHTARRIALDKADLELALPLSLLRVVAPEVLEQEITCLAERVQSGLEVLYLVDCGYNYRPDSSGSCCDYGCECGSDECLGQGGELGKDAETAEADERERQPDVFYGNGVVYREVLCLNEDSSALAVARMFGEAIRKQQLEQKRAKDEGEDICFQGVRVLTCQVL